MTAQNNDQDRLFVKDGWRHYRRRYSVTEVRWGLACLGVMLLISGWVAWKGRHPDPELFADGADLLAPATKTAAAPVAVETAAPPKTGKPAREGEGATTKDGDRGALPAGLAGAGWKEDKIAQFDPENLYVKINGRADFFRNFGFQRLYSVLLVSEKDPSVTVDIEMYQHDKAVNALGAYGGERGPDVKTEISESGLHHFDRNALYMARGQYYLRVIGSDESPVILDKLKALAALMSSSLAGEPLPWAYALLMGSLGVPPDRISYNPKNAFSFSFAQDVWTVRPKGKDDDLELFVAVRHKPADAKKLAADLGRGFLELGKAAGKLGGATVIQDNFLNTFTAATASDRWVLGARGAASKAALEKEIARLENAVAVAPAELKARAQPIPASEEPAAQETKAPKQDNAEAVDER